MSYDHDYPTKPMGGGNPYYCCAYCGKTDPQINGDIKAHASDCQYRLWKENGITPSHDGYNNEWNEPEVYIPIDEQYAIMEQQGWVLETSCPDEFRNADGSYAYGMAATVLRHYVMQEEKARRAGKAYVAPELQLDFEDTIAILKEQGWTLEGTDPLSILHFEGSKASGQAARIMIMDIVEEYMDE